jgi:hypothetical protein
MILYPRRNSRFTKRIFTCKLSRASREKPAVFGKPTETTGFTKA